MILKTLALSLWNYLYHHPDRIQRPEIKVVIPPVNLDGRTRESERELVTQGMFRDSYIGINDLLDEDASSIDDSYNGMTIDVTNPDGITLVGRGIIVRYIGETKSYYEDARWEFEESFVEGATYQIFRNHYIYNEERDYFVDQVNLSNYNNALAPGIEDDFENTEFVAMLRMLRDNFEIKHGLGASIAKSQWYGMAELKAERGTPSEVKYADADFHRMRVRAHIQMGLNVINDIDGVNVVYKSLANMSIVMPGSQSIPLGSITDVQTARHQEVSEGFSTSGYGGYSDRY